MSVLKLNFAAKHPVEAVTGERPDPTGIRELAHSATQIGATQRGAATPKPAAACAREAAQAVAQQRYETLKVELDAAAETYWCYMQPPGRPSFTPALLRDITQMQLSVKQLFLDHAKDGGRPFKYYVFGSRVPGIFNLGGDLELFAERIRAGDRDALRHYGHVSVEAIHRNATAFDLPVVTIGLVQGDALGGGFESALAMDVIVAERTARMGLPEILFNLFPGMGAYSFLARRLDAVRAEKLILSGKVYTAEELFEMGVVDVLAEPGTGIETVRDYIERFSPKHNAHHALYQTRRRVKPITLEELRDVVDIWVETALNVSEMDLKKMLRLTAAQDRRLAGSAGIRTAQMR